jgi:hypothetical protein
MTGVPIVGNKLTNFSSVRQMQPSSRILISVIAASIIPAIIFTTVSMLFDSGFRGWVIMIFPFVLLVTFAHSVLLGFPLFIFLRRFNILRWWSLTLGGFVIGVLPSLAFALFRQVDLFKDGSLSFIQGIGGVGVLGIVGALSFWFIWNYKSKPTR